MKNLIVTIEQPGDPSVGIFSQSIELNLYQIELDDCEHRERIRQACVALGDAVFGEKVIVYFSDLCEDGP
jgi:hypothetical protein